MSEQLPSNLEQDAQPNEKLAVPEAEPVKVEKAEAQTEALDVKAEAIDADKAREKAREKISKIHKPELETLDESVQSASRIIRVPLQKLEPVVETITKTWTSIRQNLKPSQQRYSKIIHNPVVASVSEFTAKTLARPYAILSGAIVAVIGSAVYLYFTRHLGYQYNYFVPILLFAAGLAVGIIVELSFKLLFAHRKK